MDMVKKNLKAIVAIFLGVFHFILLAIPFLSSYTEGADELAELGELFGIEGMNTLKNQSYSGYACLGKTVGEMKVGGFLAFSQIVFLLAAVAFLLIGGYLLTRYFLKDKMGALGNVDSASVDKMYGWIHLTYLLASILTLIAAISVAATNTANSLNSVDILTLPTITTIGFGPILGVLLAVASRIILKILKKKGKLDDIDDTASRTQFVCTQCGAIAKKGSAFCSKCGGQVVEKMPTRPMCTVCGAPAKKGDVFCSKCGGKVEEVVPTKPVCEVCGAPAKNGAAFCSLCGGKIVQK